jgi:hypothetical protein
VEPAQAKPWNGKLTRIYDTTFVRATDNIDLQEIEFAGLKTAAADVTINIVVSTGALQEPKWLKSPNAFTIQSASALAYTVHTTVQQSPSGASYNVTVQANALPTDGLGEDTCAAAFSSANALGLFIAGPDGTFVVQLVAPLPPPGYCFDTTFKLSTACAQAFSALAALNQGDADSLRAFEHAHTRSARKRDLAAYHERLRREAGTRKNANANANAPACHAPQPSPGHRL